MNTAEIHDTLLTDFICKQIGSIQREPKGCLRHPFLVPGGLFHDELWDWDSFWIFEGVVALRQQLACDDWESFLEHAVGSWKNFFENQGSCGAVPIMIKAGVGDFFGCTQEGGVEKNQAKPVLAQFALKLSVMMDDYAWLEPYYAGLKRFLERWLTRYGHSSGLLVWGSDVAIGVDNDPATWGRPEFTSANLLLNCLMHRELKAIEQIARKFDHREDADHWEVAANHLKDAVQRECWDPIDGFFYSVDAQVEDHRDRHFPSLTKGINMTWKTLPVKIKSFTGFLPLWCGIATKLQADLLVERHLRNGDEFAGKYGVRSMARNERMYDPDSDTANPSNWLGPIWVVANYMVWEGLSAYGYSSDAAEIADKVTGLLIADLTATGTIHECYDPDTGKPNFNADFLSWNVLAGAMCVQRNQNASQG